VHHTQNPTLHPVGFFLPTPAYSLGFPRVLADFDVFAEAKNSAVFALSGPIVSASERALVMPKSAKENEYIHKKQQVTCGLIERVVF
ncbi:MAG: hypothetical protein ACOYNZ_14530, partial [Rhodoferax sp.]